MKRIGRDTYIDGSLEIEGRLTSRLPDGGLSPLQVISKVLNLNVNVEFLGGYRAVEFPRKAENANITGNYTFANAPTISTPSTAPNAAARYDQITALSGSYVPLTRTVTAGSGLTGGGPLSSNITLALSDSYVQGVVRATPLTGYTVGANTALSASDTVLGALQKVQGQINAVNVRPSGLTSDFDAIPDTGFYYGDNLTANSPFIYATVIEVKRGANRRGQIAIDSYGANGAMAVRSQGVGNVMSAWYTVITTGNQATHTRGTGLTGSNYLPGTAATWAVDFGTGTNQAARGDHTHANLVAGTGLSGTTYNGATGYTWSLASGVVTPGTYKSVTVDTYGRVTAGTNPTTLSGFGITDAYDKTYIDAIDRVPGFRIISAGTGLTGGGNLYADRSFAFDTTFGDGRYVKYGTAIADNNSIPGTGIYQTDNLTSNNPFIYSAVFEMKRATNRRGQIAVDTYSANGAMAVRSQGLGDAWSSWHTVITTGNMSTLTRGTGLTGGNYTPNGGGVTWAIDFGTGGTQVAAGNHTHTFSSLTSKPTDLAGYGITDAYTKTYIDAIDRVPGSRIISAGTGLTGGGNLYADRSFALAGGVVTPGTYQKITLDTYGRGVAGANLNNTDITTALGFTPGTGNGTVAGTGTAGYIMKWASGGANAQDTVIQDTGSEINFGSGRSFGVEGAAAFRNDLHAHGAVRVGTLANHGTLIIHNLSSATIASTAALEVRSTAKGVIFSAMTHTDKTNIMSPAHGLMIFQTDLGSTSAGASGKVSDFTGTGYYFYNGVFWQKM